MTLINKSDLVSHFNQAFTCLGSGAPAQLLCVLCHLKFLSPEKIEPRRADFSSGKSMFPVGLRLEKGCSFDKLSHCETV